MSGGSDINGFRGLVDYGIDLKLESYEEEEYYIVEMCAYFNEESDFKAYLSGDRSFEVELDRSTPIMEVIVKDSGDRSFEIELDANSPLMEVIIRDSTLSILPYTDECFEAFTIMLGFIAKNHERIVSELRYEDPHRIEDPENLNLPEEDDDSDDYEWI